MKYKKKKKPNLLVNLLDHWTAMLVIRRKVVHLVPTGFSNTFYDLSLLIRDVAWNR